MTFPTKPTTVTSNDYQTLAEWLKGDVVGFVVSPARIGGRAFMTFLEYRHFAPGTPLNAEFVLVAVKWADLPWLVVIIPAAKRPLADAIMAELGLRAAVGTPHIISVVADKTTHDHFPVDPPNLFTIENIEGHFVYRNEPAQQKTAYDFEAEACDKVIAEHNARRAQRV